MERFTVSELNPKQQFEFVFYDKGKEKVKVQREFESSSHSVIQSHI